MISASSDQSDRRCSQARIPSGATAARASGMYLVRRRVRPALTIGISLCLLLSLIVWIRQELEHRIGGVAHMREQLRLLPRGDVLKAALLGYHQLGADVLWLQVIQVLGQKEVPPPDYEWAYHALDVITTLDPHYVYVYDAGGIVLAELAGHVEWSNRLLKKGLAANPEAWRLAFQLGFNHFFHLHDYRAAADYMAVAAKLPGRPGYVPELAARLYAEAKHPDLALQLLASVRQSTNDPIVIAALDRRRDEVFIERDLAVIEQAVARYWERHGRYPAALSALVEERLLDRIPVEPFGGTYELDVDTGQVRSSTHPRRLRLFRPDEMQPFTSASALP